MEELWEDIPRTFWRFARKRLGLPASPDVGRLAALMKKLYEASLLQRDSSPSVVVSYPSLLALYDEDIFDAMQYLGMRAIRYFYFYEPPHIIAAYAGHGMGLCESYNDPEKCRLEGLALPARRTLLVDYTKAALILHVDVFREAREGGYSDPDATAAFDLGSALHSPAHSNRLRQHILGFVQIRRDDWLHSPYTMAVILTGENGDDPDLQQIVKDVIEGFGLKAEFFTSAPEFIASRGAAELAWRAQCLDRP